MNESRDLACPCDSGAWTSRHGIVRTRRAPHDGYSWCVAVFHDERARWKPGRPVLGVMSRRQKQILTALEAAPVVLFVILLVAAHSFDLAWMISAGLWLVLAYPRIIVRSWHKA